MGRISENDKKMTNEQFEALKPYEPYFRTAIYSQYARYCGLTGIQTIHRIYMELTGKKSQLNTSCSTCIFRLLVDCGRLFLAEKERRDKEIADKPKPKRKKKNEV